MQSGENVSQRRNRCRIIDIKSFGSMEHGKPQARVRRIDDKFCSLDERSQSAILAHMIGYMEAARDLISAGKPARPDEISKTFGVMEDMINEAWNGGNI